MIIETNSDVIRGLLTVENRGVNQARYLIDGIFIDLSRKSPVLVSSNDMMLLAFSGVDYRFSSVKSFFIPSRILGIIKRYPSRASVTFTIKRSHLDVDYDGVKFRIEREYHCFPKWRERFPKKVSGEPAQYAPSLLNIADRAGRMITGGNGPVTVRHNGDKVAVLDYGSDSLTGLITPFAATKKPYTPPYE